MLLFDALDLTFFVATPRQQNECRRGHDASAIALAVRFSV
jgi:hypothetical protein